MITGQKIFKINSVIFEKKETTDVIKKVHSFLKTNRLKITGMRDQKENKLVTTEVVEDCGYKWTKTVL